MTDIRKKLSISQENIDVVQKFLMDENNPFVNDLLQIVDKYGGVDEINKKFKESRNIETIYQKLQTVNPEYIDDLEWLTKQRDNEAFISESEYRRMILGNGVDRMSFDESYAVTLELSSCQYFPFLIKGAKRAIQNKELLPGRIIRVRYMKEQEKARDLLAMTAAVDIIGASRVETLDTGIVTDENNALRLLRYV